MCFDAGIYLVRVCTCVLGGVVFVLALYTKHYSLYSTIKMRTYLESDIFAGPNNSKELSVKTWFQSSVRTVAGHAFHT